MSKCLIQVLVLGNKGLGKAFKNGADLLAGHPLRNHSRLWGHCNTATAIIGSCVLAFGMRPDNRLLTLGVRPDNRLLTFGLIRCRHLLRAVG